MYKNIIFDFDGTIADSFNIFCETLKEMGKTMNVKEITEKDIQEFRQKGAKEIIKDFKVMPWRLLPLIRKGQKLLGSRIDEIEPFEGIPETLRLLFEQKIKLGTITTNSKENVEVFLKKYDLNIFDFIISAPGIFGKTRTIKRTLKKYNLERDEVIYVGDESRDVESAKRAGIDMAAVTWGYNDKELLEKHNPDFLFQEPKELLILGNQKNPR
jgi:phosphoglycolate phosphatase-like HAD superfamily hydrolase